MEAHPLNPGRGAAAQARELVGDALTDSLSDEQLDSARLAISEIVNELVSRGSFPDDGTIEVNIEQFEQHVRVTISGSGDAFALPQPFLSPDRAPGYSLVLVEAASDRWGVAADARSVWFEMYSPVAQ